MSRARRVPPPETVIRGRGCACQILVPAAAIQANTALIHTIQAYTDDTNDTFTYINYRHIHTMANQRKTVFFTWAPEHL